MNWQRLSQPLFFPSLAPATRRRRKSANPAGPALFEKMRKHGINGRKIKLSEKLKAAPPQGTE